MALAEKAARSEFMVVNRACFLHGLICFCKGHKAAKSMVCAAIRDVRGVGLKEEKSKAVGGKMPITEEEEEEEEALPLRRRILRWRLRRRLYSYCYHDY